MSPGTNKSTHCLLSRHSGSIVPDTEILCAFCLRQAALSTAFRRQSALPFFRYLLACNLKVILHRFSILFILSSVATAVFLADFFFSVNPITHEPLHVARWNFVRTCTLITAESLLNFKVIGQRSRSHGFLWVFCAHNTAATRGRYLALSKAWHYLFSFIFIPSNMSF